MSGTSGSRVTITLGGSGQVVKRDGSSREGPLLESPPIVGSKRPVRERLGNNVYPSSEINYKRQRRDGWTANAADDTHLHKDDLRYKIMQKNLLKQSQSNQPNKSDLRNILSRPAQSSTSSVNTRDRMPWSNDTILKHSERMNGRHHLTETRDGRHVLSMSENSSPHIPEFWATDPRKQHALLTREIGQTIVERKDFGHRMPEQRASIAMNRMESVGSKFSPWTLDRLRQRSPDKSLETSRGPVPVAPKRDDIVEGKLAARAYDNARTSTYITKDALEITRPVSSSRFPKMAPPVGHMRAVAPVSSPLPLPLPGSLQKRSPYMVDDQGTVDSFLRSLGLEKYSILFKAEEVDMYSLKRMAERDLKELGIPLGPRKKILLSLQPHLREDA